jgi:hypothetical protein
MAAEAAEAEEVEALLPQPGFRDLGTSRLVDGLGPAVHYVVAITDPWESIPPEKRLEFEVIREPLEGLSAAAIANVERSVPAAITNVVGAPPFLVLMTKVAETTFSTIRYICADKPEDPARRLSFALSVPPLVRSLVDQIYAVVFLGEDVAKRMEWYDKAGWRLKIGRVTVGA